MKRALITGITGQDGSFLTELLLDKGYEVHGIVRRASNFNTQRIDHLFENPNIGYKTLKLHYGDMTDSSSLHSILEDVKPDEIYNLAAQSHVKVSFDVPEYTADVDGVGVLRLLDAVKSKYQNTRIFHASTSELFGGLEGTAPQNEDTPFCPRSPYAVAKLYAYWIIRNYREAYGLYACNGITFNHESERRGETFVTRKITQAVCKIVNNMQDILYIGNLDAQRDWAYAKDYVEAFWMMLQQNHPEDYVIATGETHTVREFIEEAFKYVGIDILWVNKGVEEKGINKETGKVLVVVDKRFFRPTEVDVLLGDSSRIQHALGWKPSVKFNELVKIMMEYDLSQTIKI